MKMNTKSRTAYSILILSLTFFSLAACVPTAAKRKHESMSQAAQNAIRQGNDCSLAIINDTALVDKVRHLIPFSDTDMARLMASTRMATQDDVSALHEYLNRSTRCFQIEAAGMTNVDPRFGPIYSNYISVRKNAFYSFMDGKSTLGQMNRKLNDLRDEFDLAKATADSKIVRGLEGEHNQEMSTRQENFQRSLEEYDRNVRRQQEIDRQEELRRRPVDTKCVTLGDYTDCTTQERY